MTPITIFHNMARVYSITTTFMARPHRKVLEAITKHPVRAFITSAAVGLTLTVLCVVNDFLAWKSFGTGGTPPTWRGYWRMTKLRGQRMLLFGRDELTDVSGLSTTNSPRYLSADAIGVRGGGRPVIVSRPMPQRQVPHKQGTVKPDVENRVQKMMASFASQYSDLLLLRPSITEGGSTDAIYGKETLQSLNHTVKNDKHIRLEIAHAHPSDGSLHVWLSQADAKMVVENGWGLRFPLSFVDKGWTMVYAPRTMDEAAVVEKIVKAGIIWVTGIELPCD